MGSASWKTRNVFFLFSETQRRGSASLRGNKQGTWDQETGWVGGSVIFFPCSLGRLPGGSEIPAFWPRPSAPLLSWPHLSIHTHVACFLGSLLSWVQPDAHMAATLSSCSLGHSTPAMYRESSEQKHFQVTRTGARALLIGSETSNEQWPKRKPETEKCLLPRLLLAEASVSPSTQPSGDQPVQAGPWPLVASHAPLLLSTQASPLADSKARKGGSPPGNWIGPGTVTIIQGLAAG